MPRLANPDRSSGVWFGCFSAVYVNICVSTGTTTELNLTAVFEARGIPFNPITFEGFDTLVPAYEEGQCEAMTPDTSGLGVFKYETEQKGGPKQHIMA